MRKAKSPNVHYPFACCVVLTFHHFVDNSILYHISCKTNNPGWRTVALVHDTSRQILCLVPRAAKVLLHSPLRQTDGCTLWKAFANVRSHRNRCALSALQACPCSRGCPSTAKRARGENLREKLLPRPQFPPVYCCRECQVGDMRESRGQRCASLRSAWNMNKYLRLQNTDYNRSEVRHVIVITYRSLALELCRPRTARFRPTKDLSGKTVHWHHEHLSIPAKRLSP